MMLKTWIRDAEIKDVGAYFSVSDARRELSPWGARFAGVQPGVYAGVSEPGRPVGEGAVPAAGQNRRWVDEDADRADGVWRIGMTAVRTEKFQQLPFHY